MNGWINDTQMPPVILRESTVAIEEFCFDAENVQDGSWDGWVWDGQEKGIGAFYSGGGMMQGARKTNSSKI